MRLIRHNPYPDYLLGFILYKIYLSVIDSNNTNTCSSQGFTNVPIPYEVDKPVEPNAWDGEAHSISIFGTMKFLEIDSMNITTSLLCMANFIKNRSVDCKLANSITQLKGFGQAAWKFISSIYKAGWNSLNTKDNSKMFRQNIAAKFTPKSIVNKPVKTVELSKDKQAEVVRLPFPIPARPSKKILEKSKKEVTI